MARNESLRESLSSAQVGGKHARAYTSGVPTQNCEIVQVGSKLSIVASFDVAQVVVATKSRVYRNLALWRFVVARFVTPITVGV